MNPNISIKERHAVTWLCSQGYTLTLEGLRDLHNFELKNKDTGKIECFDIAQVVADYNQNRKDEARMRAAERRQNATHA